MSFLNGYFEEVHFRGVLPKVLYNDKQKMLIFVWHSGGGLCQPEAIDPGALEGWQERKCYS